MSNPIIHPREHIAQWRASGLSRAAYCRMHGIVYHTTRFWNRTSETERAPAGTNSGFIEVMQPKAEVWEVTPPSLASIALPMGAVLRVSVGADPQWIGRVISAVRPC